MNIRKYLNNDITDIEKINGLAALQIKYHKGVQEKNIICAVDNDSIIGFGLLIMPQVIKPKGKQKIEFSISISDEYKNNNDIKSLLTDGLMKRFNVIKTENPDMNLCMRICCKTNEISDMEFFLEKGFSLYSVIPVMKYDLTRETKHYHIPDNISIQKYDFTEQSMKSYLTADFEANDIPDSEPDIWFRTGAPDFSCYAAMCNGEIVGAVSVWSISEEGAATENIFVIPQYRRKNIAKALISTAFDELKNQGMKIATLSLLGTNLPAMKLYLSCGYTLYYNLLEMIYE